MNTDDNERLLAQKAIRGVGLPRPLIGIDYGYVSPRVQRAKGFDSNAQRAERRAKARQKAHKRRQAKTPT